LSEGSDPGSPEEGTGKGLEDGVEEEEASFRCESETKTDSFSPFLSSPRFFLDR
jgi:hypothetical protein